MQEPEHSIHPIIGPREIVYQNPYQYVYRVRVDFGSFAKEIFVTNSGHRVGVVVEGEQGILLTRQYRYLIDRISWEIPGGKVEPGEVLEEAARRECMEETGIYCRNLKPFLMFHPGLDTLYNPSHLMCTHDFEEKVKRDALYNHEVSGREWVPLQECIAMISGQVIVDSLSVIALLSYNTFMTRHHVGDG